ncbi:hypothetical protein K3495_g6635 [Podosphaera aphanis]|nr:hypothetical protein K3495_g6635 [Podosphaera aphanis]
MLSKRVSKRVYILGCMSCTKHGTARRSQTQSSAKVDAPLVMIGMEFIRPLPEGDLSVEETIKVCYPQLNKYEVNGKSGDQPPYWGFSGKEKFTHIFVVVDYFSQFMWAFPYSTPDQAEAIRCLIWLFNIFEPPISIYADIGSHFTGRSMKQFLKDHKVVFTPAPLGAKRATGMVEKSNNLLEMILKKQFKKKSWPLHLNRGVYGLNRREIKHFGF